jgi:proline iminopeptidase
MQNGFYSPKAPTEEAQRLYAAFKEDTLRKYAAQMTYPAPLGFWQHERYTTLDLTPHLLALKGKGVPVYGLYGKDDGLYPAEAVHRLQGITGPDRLQYLDDASHSVFIDRQEAFITALRQWLKQDRR